MKSIESLLKYSKNISVLYAEDHDELRIDTQQILKNFFKRVDAVPNGAEALEIYENSPSRLGDYYEIVITDIRMPKMDGVELIENIYKINPKQNVIVISAHDESHYLLPLINMGIKQFLQKPIELDKFLDVLQTVSQKIVKEDMHVSLDDTSYYDKKSKILIVNNEDIALTKYEMIFMDLISTEKGKIYKNEEIADYYREQEENIDMSNIRKLISKLRQKLPKNTIESIYSVGYRLVTP